MKKNTNRAPRLWRHSVTSLRAISIKKASARAVNTVIAKCRHNRGARLVFTRPGPYRNATDLDCISLMKLDVAPRTFASPRQKIFISRLVGDQGYQRTSVLIQRCKHSCLNCTLRSRDPWTRWAADALLRRGPTFSVITPQAARPGFWISILITLG